jgi:hypothetical protein
MTNWSYDIEELLLLRHILDKERTHDEADLNIGAK